MKLPVFILVFFTFAGIETAEGQNSDYKHYLLEQQLPDWFLNLYKSAKIGTDYQIADFINPFYLEADFNWDGHTDIAVLIEDTLTKKEGIIVFHGQIATFFILGAGTKSGNGGDDFDWMDIWKVYQGTSLEPGVGETEKINLKGPALWVEKSESASAVIYWTGTKYTWYQQGD